MKNTSMMDWYTAERDERSKNAALIAPAIEQEKLRRIDQWQEFLRQNEAISQQNLINSSEKAVAVLEKEQNRRFLEHKISDRFVFHHERQEREHNRYASMAAEEAERQRRIAYSWEDSYDSIRQQRNANAALIAPAIEQEKLRRIDQWQNFLRQNEAISEQNLFNSTQKATALLEEEKTRRIRELKVSDQFAQHHERQQSEYSRHVSMAAEEAERQRRIAHGLEEQKRTTMRFSTFMREPTGRYATSSIASRNQPRHVGRGKYKRSQKERRVLAKQGFANLCNVLGVSCGRGRNNMLKSKVLDQAIQVLSLLKSENAMLHQTKQRLSSQAQAVQRKVLSPVPLSSSASAFPSNPDLFMKTDSPMFMRDDAERSRSSSMDTSDLSFDINNKVSFDWSLGAGNNTNFNTDLDLDLDLGLDSDVNFDSLDANLDLDLDGPSTQFTGFDQSDHQMTRFDFGGFGLAA